MTVKFGKRILAVLAAMLLACLGICQGGGITAAVAETAEEQKSLSEMKVPAPDFTLKDQYGATHTLSDYQGKVVFLNFWATWCPWCIYEMPSIEELYHELGENQEQVVMLGIGSPKAHDTADEAGIIAVLEENGITYPTLMDTTGEIFTTYGASTLPLTWLIQADGSLFGYYIGALQKDQMLLLIQKTMESTPE